MFCSELVQPLVHCFAYDDVIPIKTTDNVVAVHQVVVHAKALANVQFAGYLAYQFIRVNAELAAVHDSSVVDVDEVCHVLNVWFCLSKIASFE
jgi:hypothetical protein